MKMRLATLVAAALPHCPTPARTHSALEVWLQEVEAGRIAAHPAIKALLERLRSYRGIALFRGRSQVVVDVARGVSHVFVADWLLRRSRVVGATQAVEDLTRYIRSKELPFQAIVAVGGIKPSGSYELAEGARLLPWKELPDLRRKRSVDEAESFHRSFYRPDAALLRDVRHPRVHVKQPSVLKRLERTDWTLEQDTLLCIGLVGPSAPVLLASWLEPPDWAPMIVGSLSMPFVEGSGRSTLFSQSAAREAADLCAAWFALPAARRAELRVPMERLNSAMRRTTAVDSAIDLGIVLESVFLSDVGDHSELTFRLRVRAARWLGKTETDRGRLGILMRDLYGLRSKAVHSGRVPNVTRGRSTLDLLGGGYKTAAAALRALITDGDPDWDAITYG